MMNDLYYGHHQSINILLSTLKDDIFFFIIVILPLAAILTITNYHVFRAGVIASKQNLDVEGIGAKTKTYFWINAFIREFVATLVSERKSHIKTLIILMIIFILITTIQLI